ncbi:MAG TPA: TraM recognition domain-containing protein, partial [Candidatus Saccharimonadales bacterium]|nr:TraM recognition domain-containing protein [Candidatus Saccharimonadales bacterium]
LSKGLIGEDNASILGAFMVTKIQLAAMSRSDIPDINDRRPFYLYVDEFQNFATDSFATILSEARKYGLNLTVANQYISQMSDTVRNAVFGNVGTMITFRVSADDAPILSKQFEPQFEPNDLLQMHNRHFIINMVISGEKSPAFSATTLTLPPPQIDNTGKIIENTRRLYSRNRADIEAEITAATQPQTPPPKAPQPAQKQWPINAQSQVVTPDAQRAPAQQSAAPRPPQQNNAPSAPAASSVPTNPNAPAPAEDGAPPKRKRSRNRKRKPSSGAAGEGGSLPPVGGGQSQSSSPAPQAPPQQQHPQPLDSSRETEIRLR